MSSTKVYHQSGGFSDSKSPQEGLLYENSMPNLINPTTSPTIRPQNAPGSFVLGQKIARRYTAQMGGAWYLVMDWM